MNKRRRSRPRSLLNLAILTLLAGTGLLLWTDTPLESRFLEQLINLASREYFGGSLRLKDGAIDRRFALRLSGIRASLLTETGSAPLELEALSSQSSLFEIFGRNGLFLPFEGLRPRGSRHEGLGGFVRLKQGRTFSYHLTAQIRALDLAEIRWLNPDNLSGSAGVIRGSMILLGSSDGQNGFEFKIESAEGSLQSRFFQPFLPYLPPVPEKKKLKSLARSEEIVAFQEGSLQAAMPAPDRLKIFMHIVVPDYTMNLNLNLEVKIDEENAFLQLAHWMGLARIQTS
jgi:hypothetical protein